MVKLRSVLRAIRKHFPKPPDSVLAANAIEKFLDNLELCEDKLSEEAGSEGFSDTMMKIVFSENEPLKICNSLPLERCGSLIHVTIIWIISLELSFILFFFLWLQL